MTRTFIRTQQPPAPHAAADPRPDRDRPDPDGPPVRLEIVPAPACEPVGVPSSAGDTTAVLASAPPPPVAPARRAPVGVPAATIEARRFAIAIITAVFEVIDRRRPAHHLEPVMSAHLVEHVDTLVRADLAHTDPAGVGVAAHVRRVHIQMRDATTAEIFGSYERGRRVRAFAGRIERVPCRVRQAPTRNRPTIPVRVAYRWRLVEFALT
ncbi:Rv3235 family protein [Gordonia sp. NPDC003950]